MARTPPAPPGGGDKPKETKGFFANLREAAREISREVRRDIANVPPPNPVNRGPEAAPFRVSDQLVRTVNSARQGGAFVEETSPFAGPQTPLPPPAPPVPLPILNPWPQLREGGAGLGTDAYFHAYSAPDMPHYLKAMGARPEGRQMISLLCVEAGDREIYGAFDNALRREAGSFGSVGYNPRNPQADLAAMDEALTGILNRNPKILALGPVGLDLNYTTDNLAQQTAQLLRQLEIARDFGVPALIFHNKAVVELRGALEQGGSRPRRLVWLKPVRSAEELELIQEYDCYVIFRAELTWPSETFYREAVGQILPQRWLVGSGNSLKTTHARAGQFNSAAGLPEIVKTLAEIADTDAAQVWMRVNMNFAQVYGPAVEGA
jgi:Tat protein secretion system quality control protein TatD with DNase activity